MMINFDFDSITNRILENLSGKSEWVDFLNSGVTVNLVKSIAQELAYEMQTKEYYTFENWWKLARNKSSLLAEAPSLGYIVPRKKGATGVLKVSVDQNFSSAYASDLVIPKYFQFSNGSFYFSTVEESTLSSLENYIDINIKQGESKSVNFTAFGSVFETYTINDGNVDNDTFDLYVNDILWTPIDNIFNASENQQVYEIYSDPSLNKIILKFGNTIFGKKLSNGDNVVFKYISTLGDKGNEITTGAINVVESILEDDLGNFVQLYCTNTGVIGGGQGYPSIEEIRSNGPRIVKAGDRNISSEDYITTLDLNTTLSKINVWGIYEYMEDNNLDIWSHVPTEENVVHIAALDSGYTSIHDNTSVKNQIINLLKPKSPPESQFMFDEIEKIPLVFTTSAVATNTNYSASSLISSIQSALSTTYHIQNMDFYDSIYYSSVVSLIGGIPGIRNHTTTISTYKEFNFYEIGILSKATTTLPLTPVKISSVKIYVKDTTTNANASYVLCGLVGIDNRITSVGGFTVNGNLNPITGLINIIISSPSYVGKLSENLKIKVDYTIDSLDISVTKRNHILNYDSSSISIRYP